jgi:hypothetical protein
MVQNRQRLWCTALAVLQKTRGEEVVGVQLLGMVSHHPLHLVGYLFTFMVEDARSHEIKKLKLKNTEVLIFSEKLFIRV